MTTRQLGRFVFGLAMDPNCIAIALARTIFHHVIRPCNWHNQGMAAVLADEVSGVMQNA